MSTPANFNGARPVIDVNDTAMLLIDHQSGLFQTVGDMPMPEPVSYTHLPSPNPGENARR